MKRVWLVSLLSGCSLLFDPSRVPESDCPTSPRRCPERANATAVCVEASCGFTCAEGFRDADGLAETGCEASCMPLPAPSALSATSRDDGTSLEWSFPAIANATGYRLCTSVSAGTPSCLMVPTTSCADGRCTVLSLSHPPKTTVFGQIQSVDSCGGPTPEAMATRSQGFTVRTLDYQPWTGDNCMPTVTVTGEVLTVDHTICQSWSNVGDETWRGGTFEVDLRPSASANNMAGGFLFTSGTRRIAIVIAAERAPVGEGTLLVRESRASNPFWTTLATSGAFLPTGRFTRLRVVQRGASWSVSVGASASSMTEVLRFRDEDRGDAPFRVGLHALSLGLFSGAGRIDFQRVTVSPDGALPATGPVSRTTTFDAMGPVPTARLTGTDQVRFEPCPAFPPASGCPSCAPAPASRCARITKVFAGTVTVDVPPGIDPTQPWSLAMRVAPTADGGTPNGAFVSSPWGVIAEPLPDGGVRGLGGEWGGAAATRDVWHRVEVRFTPGPMRFQAVWDGANVSTPMTRFPPLGWNAFGGAFILGGTGLDGIDFWVCDVTVSQP
jgi:hypothetical protein